LQVDLSTMDSSMITLLMGSEEFTIEINILKLAFGRMGFSSRKLECKLLTKKCIVEFI